MDIQDFNRELLDYLYDEMTPNEKKEFEQKLSGSETLQHELRELTSVREELDGLKDKEVMEPFSTWGKTRSSRWFDSNQRTRKIIFRPVTAVAASLVILMLVGYLTNFSISVSGDGFQAGFSSQVKAEDQTFLSEAEVQSLVNQEVQRSNKALIARLTQAEEGYNQKINMLETSLKSVENRDRNAPVTNEDLQKFFVNAENKNAEIMKEYLKLTSTQQHEYFRTMLTQFNDFYRQQREDDLTLIQTSLLEMQQNQSVQKQETDQAITSLYTTVNQRRN